MVSRDDCRCAECVERCRFAPGWFSPEEAERAMSAGLSGKMMLDYYIGDDRNVYALSPAVVGCEGTRARNTEEMFGHLDLVSAMFFRPGKGVCVFLENDLCTIHDSGHKPIQCRESFACRDTGPGNDVMVPMWDTDAGRTIVTRWMAAAGMTKDVLKECT